MSDSIFIGQECYDYCDIGGIQESIKSVEQELATALAEIKELKIYKENWQSIGGKANAKNYGNRLDIALEVIKIQEEEIDKIYDGNDWNGTWLKQFQEIKEKVKPLMEKLI